MHNHTKFKNKKTKIAKTAISISVLFGCEIIQFLQPYQSKALESLRKNMKSLYSVIA